jgi:hypothetical protein
MGDCALKECVRENEARREYTDILKRVLAPTRLVTFVKLIAACTSCSRRAARMHTSDRTVRRDHSARRPPPMDRTSSVSLCTLNRLVTGMRVLDIATMRAEPATPPVGLVFRVVLQLLCINASAASVRPNVVS